MFAEAERAAAPEWTAAEQSRRVDRPQRVEACPGLGLHRAGKARTDLEGRP